MDRRLLALAAPLLLAACAARPSGPGRAATSLEEFGLRSEPAPAAAPSPAPGGLEEAVAAASPAGKEDDRWRFSATPFLWAARFDASVDVKGRSTASTLSFGDIWDHLDVAGMLHLEASRGRWSAFGEFLWVDLGADGTGPLGGEVDLSFTQAVANLNLGYRLLGDGAAPGGGAALPASLEGYAGARYTRLHAKLDPAAAGSATGGLDWVDPVVGIRARLDASPALAFVLRGDVGGFGGSSDQSWYAQGGLHWRASAAVSLELGWAILTQRYREGDDPDDLAVRTAMSGPFGGVTFRF